jgi:hypothetical protein
MVRQLGTGLLMAGQRVRLRPGQLFAGHVIAAQGGRDHAGEVLDRVRAEEDGGGLIGMPAQRVNGVERASAGPRFDAVLDLLPADFHRPSITRGCR